jgi:hypothetical protein
MGLFTILPELFSHLQVLTSPLVPILVALLDRPIQSPLLIQLFSSNPGRPETKLENFHDFEDFSLPIGLRNFHREESSGKCIIGDYLKSALSGNRSSQ